MAVEEIDIYKNDSALYDDFLAHRIGLIPLKNQKLKEGDVVEMKLSVKADGKMKEVLAKDLNGEIVNCDSVQIYKDFIVGSAQPSKEDQLEVREALKRLPQTEQEVVRLRIHGGLTFAEVAEKLQIPLGTVLTRMRSALQRLKQKLQSSHQPPTTNH